MSTSIDFGKRVTLSEAATLISNTPAVRFLLRGERGIGKSSLMGTLAALNPDHAIGYIDCQCKDLGDVSMPVVNIEERVTYYAPNAGFQLSHNSTKPVILMLDEFTKAVRPVQNMLHPLLEEHNPRLGDIPLPKGSIVFLTGNLAQENLNDTLLAHTMDRVTELEVAKPDASSWVPWAIDNGVDPAVIAFVERFPHVLASFRDGGQEENPYIAQPNKVQRQVVTPRSLVRASNLVKQRASFTDNALLAALVGTIGEAGARDLQAFIAYQDQLPTWESILKSPKTAQVPDSPGACAVLVFGAIARMDKSAMTPFMEYLSRFEPEWQATFAIHMAHGNRQSIAFSSTSFSEWVAQNEDIL